MHLIDAICFHLADFQKCGELLEQDSFYITTDEEPIPKRVKIEDEHRDNSFATISVARQRMELGEFTKRCEHQVGAKQTRSRDGHSRCGLLFWCFFPRNFLKIGTIGASSL